MKLRKFFAGAVAGIMAVATLGISSFAATEGKQLLISLEDEEFQQIADSNQGSFNTTNAGSGLWEMDGTNLKKTERKSDYDSLDVKMENLSNGKFVFVAKASVETGVIRLCIGVSPYGDVQNAVIEDGTITYEFEVEDGKAKVQVMDGEVLKDIATSTLRIQTDADGATSDLIIESVQIYGEEGTSIVTQEPEPEEEETTTAAQEEETTTAAEGDTTTTTTAAAGNDADNNNEGGVNPAIIVGCIVGAIVIVVIIVAVAKKKK